MKRKGPRGSPDEAQGKGAQREEHEAFRGKTLDTLDQQAKLAGRRRPPPRRGLEGIVDKAAVRHRGLVVGALPAHVEVLFSEDEERGAPTRDDVKIVRVHPALVATLQSPLVVGDRITVAELENGQLYAIEAEPRQTILARPVVERERLPQPIAANAATLWVVVAVASPPMRPGLVDRFFVAAAAGGLVPKLCVTKIDLPSEERSDEWVERYEKLGFEVHRTSAVTGEGIERMRASFAGNFSVLVGQSGVGKSSIVRRIIPETPIAVGEISQATGKGRHTTTVTRYYLLPERGAVVDTPGLRELGLWGADRSHLDVAFPDVADLAQGCRFDDCRHLAEPGCAVREAPGIPEERLSSFRKLSDEIDQRLRPGYGKPGGPS